MKQIKVQFQCPGDKLQTAVLFKRPSPVGAEIVQFDCSACGSHLLAKVKRAKDFLEKGQVIVQVKIVRPSAQLIAMLREGQEARSAAAAAEAPT